MGRGGDQSAGADRPVCQAVHQQSQSGSQPARVQVRYPSRPSFFFTGSLDSTPVRIVRCGWVPPSGGGLSLRTSCGCWAKDRPCSDFPPFSLRGLSLGPDRPRVHFVAFVSLSLFVACPDGRFPINLRGTGIGFYPAPVPDDPVQVAARAPGSAGGWIRQKNAPHSGSGKVCKHLWTLNRAQAHRPSSPRTACQ